MAFTQRTADWVITRAYAHSKKKGSAPVAGTDKYTVLLGLLDSIQKDWADEDIEWESLYQKVNNGTVTATDTFDLDDEIQYISKAEDDHVLLVSPDGTKKVPYTLVNSRQLYKYRNTTAVAQLGRTLKFSRPFQSTDTTIGYTIQVPARLGVDDITSGTDTVQITDPMYAVYMLAAEDIRDDVVKKDQYDNLLSLAANKMEKMKADNGGSRDELMLEPIIEGALYL